MNKHYIVTGGGRTGSHWVEQIIKFIAPESEVWHTNNTQDLINYSDEIKKNSTLICCRRQDVFSAAISYFVARHTDEWFHYSPQHISPFIIDVTIFQEKIKGIVYWHYILDNEVAPLYSNDIINVWYEDLNCTPENHIARLLNITNKQGQNNWDLSKNPRDYSKIIANYRELREIYLQNQ